MRIALYLEAEVLKIAVSVGIAICKVNLVIFIKKGIIPSQGKVRLIFSTTFAIPIFIVLDIFPSSVPAQVLLFRFPLRIDYHFHTHFIQVIHFVLI